MSDAEEMAALRPVAFAALAGWADDDHRAALAAFRRGAAVLDEHPVKERRLGVDAAALSAALRAAAALPDDLTQAKAREFFEARFVPHEAGAPDGGGFFTGFYEPIVAGSRRRSARFAVPLYRVPDDLVAVDPERPPAGLDPSYRFARRTADGLSAYPDRGEIAAGCLDGRGLELVYLADPVDAYFIHVQGAARIELAEGGAMRVTYAAKTGHPYTSIGRVLVEAGTLTLAEATMQGIRAWLRQHPGEAAATMARNRSFIFFREAPVSDPALGPIAAAKVPLAAGRSLAVDRLLYSFHIPVWVETTLPDGSPFRRLLVAHDTGSAIVGPARGDLFLGSGDAAGEIAGRMRAPGRFVVLVPRGGA
jgi:membrane-bound lytic murein transglycosylase A